MRGRGGEKQRRWERRGREEGSGQLPAYCCADSVGKLKFLYQLYFCRCTDRRDGVRSKRNNRRKCAPWTDSFQDASRSSLCTAAVTVLYIVRSFLCFFFFQFGVRVAREVASSNYKRMYDPGQYSGQGPATTLACNYPRHRNRCGPTTALSHRSCNRIPNGSHSSPTDCNRA